MKKLIPIFLWIILFYGKSCDSSAKNIKNFRYIDNILYAMFSCKDKPENTRLLVPGSCSQYYECKNGLNLLRNCPKFYDPKTGNCIEYSDCIEMPIKTPKPPIDCKGLCCGRLTGYVVDPVNPAQYYKCENHKSIMEKCPGNLHFNLAKLICDEPSNCYEITTEFPKTTKSTTTTTTTPCPTKSTTSKTSPHTTTIIPCQTQTSCLQQNSDSLTKNEDKFVIYSELCFGKENGYTLSDSNSCNRYYSCWNNMAKRLSCGDFHFNSKTKLCDHPTKANCHLQ